MITHFLILSLLAPGQAAPAWRIIVRSGDTPERLAAVFLAETADWPEVADRNSPLNPNTLLELPPGGIRGERFPFIHSAYSQAEIVPRGQEVSIAARGGVILEPGDSLRTSLQGGIELRYPGKRRLLLRGGGILECRKPSAEGAWRVKLRRGVLEARWETDDTKDAGLEIVSGPAQIRAEKAFFRLRARDDGRIYLEVFQGTARVRTGNRETEVPAGNGIRLPD